MKFYQKHFLTFIFLLLLEIIIAQTSGFIRHTFGDFLVVILLFYLVKAFFNFSNKTIGIIVLIFAYAVEFLQLTPLLEFLGLENNRLAVIIFGATFSFVDLVAYTLGIITVLLLEKFLTRKLSSNLS
ncbi:ribosomal maturation YjgA family protein [Tenacibaculum aestuarii]|uniref:ribosomal maturation YjgA family protein n=1 Tax=Tenacibaculum aestuarii TaxID=362781 RepID=UPI003893EB38